MLELPGRPARSLATGFAAALLALLVGACSRPVEIAEEPPPTFDTVVAGGRVIDPESGLDAVRDVGILDGSVVEISETPLGDRIAEGGRMIDATGLVVAPGFIDLHVHGQSDAAREYQARDGVTTALELEWGFPEVGAFLDSRRGRSRIHFGAAVSHGVARAVAFAESEQVREGLRERGRQAAGTDEPLQPSESLGADTFYRPLPEGAFEVLAAELRRGLEEGGLGFGVAHQYYPGATREEIFRVFELAAELEAPIFTHVRSMSLDAMQEVVADAAATGAPLHIVHVNSMSLGAVDTVLDLIRGAREHGVDVTTEAYPYTAASTSIGSAIFDEGWQERLGISYGDVQWQDTGERLTEATFARYRANDGVVIIHLMKEEWIERALGNDWVMVASDGMPYAPGAHPRTAGTFARVLGRYVRERQVLDLPTAIAKMTLLPARRLEGIAPQMARKGRVQEGADADLAIFDPEAVVDTATFEDGLAFSEGIVHVLVGGVPVVTDGESVDGVFPGEAIRGRYSQDD